MSVQHPTLHRYLKDAGVVDIPSSLPDFPMEWVPKPHQVYGLNLILRSPRFGLFDDAGTGKSLIMQAVSLLYVAWGNKIICLMPPATLDQFVETTHTNYKTSDRWLSHKIIDKPPATRDKWFSQWDMGNSWPGMLLMSYEMFLKLVPILKDRGYNVLITDEAQKLRGSESNVHAAVYNYTADEGDTALLLATGTPQHHTPIDCYAMTRLINRKAYASLKTFKRLHCNIKSFRIGRRIRGRMRQVTVEEIESFKNLDTMNCHLYANARRVELGEVTNLTRPTIVPVTLKLAPAHQKIYNTLAKERMLEIGEERVITAKEASQLREHLMGIACDPSDYSEKPVQNKVFDEVEALLDSIGPTRKVLLYAHHNRVIEALADRFAKLNPVLVYGGSRSSTTKNRKAIKAFQADSDHRLLIAHPQSGGVGLNFQHVCHHIIFVEPTSIQGDFSQVIARVLREGQKEGVLVYILKIMGTVYPKMVEVMLDNSDLAKEVNLDMKSFRAFVEGK